MESLEKILKDLGYVRLGSFHPGNEKKKSEYLKEIGKRPFVMIPSEILFFGVRKKKTPGKINVFVRLCEKVIPKKIEEEVVRDSSGLSDSEISLDRRRTLQD